MITFNAIEKFRLGFIQTFSRTDYAFQNINLNEKPSSAKKGVHFCGRNLQQSGKKNPECMAAVYFLKKNCILQFPRESFKCCVKRKTFSFKFNMKWIQNNYYNKFTTVFLFFPLQVQRSRTIQILLEIKLPFPYRCLSD